MSRIAVVSRNPLYANGIVEALKKQSQVFSYQAFSVMKLEHLSNNVAELKSIDCLIYCVDFKKDFQLFEKLSWSRSEMSLIIASPLNLTMLENFARKYDVQALLDSNIEVEEFVRCVEHIFLADTNETMSIVRPGGMSSLSASTSFGLTKREQQILNLISLSLNNKEIAKRLFISDHTVSVHRKNLMKKLKVNNAAGLISKAFREHLIEI